jgi:RND superfamily putative drug exporter
MDRIAASVAGAGRRLPGTTARDTRGSPGFFRSGYLTLAALDGTPRRTRRLAATIVSIDRGGRAARLMVIPRSGPDEAATDRLRSRLVATARAYADGAGTSATVGGEGAVLADFDRATQDRILPTVAALSLITFLVLIPIFRSLLLPLVAVSLTLVTVLATYGALRLLLQGAHPVLGGPGYVSSIAAIGIFAVIFALSIDYVVFLVTRMREAHERGLPTDAAIDHGLVWSGRVVTGAAMVMIAVFLAFATTDFSGIREFGVALAIAVALDATAMRMFLLPAIMRVLGPWSWWLPRPLEALLPRPRTTWAPAPDPPGGV